MTAPEKLATLRELQKLSASQEAHWREMRAVAREAGRDYRAIGRVQRMLMYPYPWPDSDEGVQS